MNTLLAYDLDAAAIGHHRLAPRTDHSFQANRWAETIGPHAIDEIKALTPTPTTNDGWVEAYLSLASSARKAGREVDAAIYERGAEFFMTADDPRKAPARERFVSTMRTAFDLSPEPVAYQGAHLPAYDLPAQGLAPGETPVSTWVCMGGFDSCIEELFPLLVGVAARGHRVVAFDGPGQGSALEEQGLTMTPHWHRPVGAVLDHFGLHDVTLVGMSLGGGLALRAAAFEPRVSRVAAWDVLEDFLEVCVRQLAPLPRPLTHLIPRLPATLLNQAIGAGRSPVARWGLAHGMRVTGTRTPAQLLRAAARLGTADISARVRADVLLLAGAEDHYVPTAQLARQASALSGARSVTTRLFTPAEQAAAHCQVGNMGLAMRTICAWERGLAPTSAR